MVTLKDVARELGLSTGTVSMALNNSPLISADTARQVRAARHWATPPTTSDGGCAPVKAV